MRARLFPLAAGALSIAALSLATVREFSPLLVWNASASAPIGLYRIDGDSLPQIDDLVLVRPDPALELFLSGRGYLPPSIPLIKRVAALSGAEICRRDETIFIDRIRVADALSIDSLDRQMPVWSGCFTLNSDEVFLLNRHEKSLDGRYFGATKISNVTGVALPILMIGPKQ
jgi:conjugative transfer signal peptidase TraF